MKEQLLPWYLRSADFYKPNWHTRPTIGFELLFEFLRLSPSYELARKASMEGLSTADQLLLPPDFEQVKNTYQLLGDVQKILFRQWWIARGLSTFGNPYARPKLHSVAHLAGGKDISAETLVGNFESYLAGARHEEGLVDSVLIAVPLGLRQSEIRKQMSAILTAYSGHEQNSLQSPLIKLQGKRLRSKVLFNGLRLLWFKAAKPQWEHWRLGAKSRFSVTYSKELNPANPRRVVSTLESYDREMMTKITNRALKKFESIAENAARGRFPSQDPVHPVDFQYPFLAKRIQRKNTWEQEEKARLLAAFRSRRH